MLGALQHELGGVSRGSAGRRTLRCISKWLEISSAWNFGGASGSAAGTFTEGERTHRAVGVDLVCALRLALLRLLDGL